MRCGCEHIRHFPDDALDTFPLETFPRDGHAYMSVDAGGQRAQFVGEVCDECARECVSEYLIREETA